MSEFITITFKSIRVFLYESNVSGCAMAAGETQEKVSNQCANVQYSVMPATGMLTGHMGAAWLIAAGQHGEMFL